MSNQDSQSSALPGITRRKAIKAAAGAAIALPAFVPSSVFGAGSPSNRLNVAVIGLGSQGRRMVSALMRLNVNIVALCDVDERQSALTKRQNGLDGAVRYVDYREMLHNEKSIQAVVIAYSGSLAHAPVPRGHTSR